jgi:N-acetylglucosamine-6-phosphate deacetylase
MAPIDYLLVNARLVLANDVIKGGALLVRGGLIDRVILPGDALPLGLVRKDAGDAYVTPGLIELHIHGAGGVGFDALGEGPEEGASRLRAAGEFLRARGVTTFVPTLVCREEELDFLAAAIEAAGLAEVDLPGIYVEGPFIAPSKKGGIPLDTIQAPDPAVLDRVLRTARGRIRLMTLAPELPGASGLYAPLADAGIVPCLGHSDCSIDRITLPRGKYSITHLFNAMSAFSHRQGEEGLAMLPFAHDVPFVELNGDGVHVNETALRAAARALDPGRLVLISDATVAAGLPYGDYSYYGMRIKSGPDGVRYADSGLLMGSNRLAPDVLLNWLRQVGASVPVAVGALTRVPARLLGIDDRRGALAEGLEAKLVIWEGEFERVREVLE